MAEVAKKIQWPTFFKVASPSWTSGAYAGDILVDANMTQFPIQGNESGALILDTVDSPAPGVVFSVGSSPAWTVNAYAKMWLVQPANNYLIVQNTAGAFVVQVLPGQAAPLTTGGWYVSANPISPLPLITSGQFPGTVTVTDSFWQIITPAGVAVTDSTVSTGAVTVVPGGETLNVALDDSTVVASLPIKVTGCSHLTAVAGFASGSSPVGGLNFEVNNSAAPLDLKVGVVQTGGHPGPDAFAVEWSLVGVQTGVTAATLTAIAMTATFQSLIVGDPGAWVWLRAIYTADASAPGTGELEVQFYGYGAAR